MPEPEFGQRQEGFQLAPGLGRRRVVREYKGPALGWTIVEGSEGSWIATAVTEPGFEPIEEEVPIKAPLVAEPVRDKAELPTDMMPVTPPEQLRAAVAVKEELVARAPPRRRLTAADMFGGLQFVSPDVTGLDIGVVPGVSRPAVRRGIITGRPLPPYPEIEFKPERLGKPISVVAEAERKVITIGPEGIGEARVPLYGVRLATAGLAAVTEAGRAALFFVPETSYGIGYALGRVARGESAAGVGGEIIVGALQELAETGEAIIRAPGKLFKVEKLTETERKELTKEVRVIGRFAGRTGAAAVTTYVLRKFPGVAKTKIQRIVDKIKGKKQIVQMSLSAAEYHKKIPITREEPISVDPKLHKKLVWDVKKQRIVEKVLQPKTTVKVGKDWVAIYERVPTPVGVGAVVPAQPILVRPDVAAQLVKPIPKVTPPITALRPPVSLPVAAAIGLIAPQPTELIPPKEFPVSRVRPAELITPAVAVGIAAVITPKAPVAELPKVEEVVKPREDQEIIPAIIPAITPRITPRLAPPPTAIVEAPRLAPPTLIAPPKEPRRVDKPKPMAPLPPLYPFPEVKRRRFGIRIPKLKRPTRYVPSFAAIALGITATKRPTVLTGLELRPIIVSERPTKKKVKVTKKKPKKAVFGLQVPSLAALKFPTLATPKKKKKKKIKKKPKKRVKRRKKKRG